VTALAPPNVSADTSWIVRFGEGRRTRSSRASRARRRTAVYHLERPVLIEHMTFRCAPNGLRSAWLACAC
jgi:hypothetical protein